EPGVQRRGQGVGLEGRAGLETGGAPVRTIHGQVDGRGAGLVDVEAVAQVLGQGPHTAVAGCHDRLSGELRGLLRWYVLLDGFLGRLLGGTAHAGTDGQTT